MQRHLARSWEDVFANTLPERLDIVAGALASVLRSFRLRMAQRPQPRKAPSFALVTRQVENLEESVKDTAGLKGIVSTGQKEASRLFVPTIAEAMSGGYARCARESSENSSHLENVHGY